MLVRPIATDTLGGAAAHQMDVFLVLLRAILINRVLKRLVTVCGSVFGVVTGVLALRLTEVYYIW